MMAVCWAGAGLTSGASWGAGEGEGMDEDDAAADMGCSTEMALDGQEIAVRSRRSCCRFGCFPVRILIFRTSPTGLRTKTPL